MFPVNILTHKNSIRLLQIQPSLIKIKRRYAGDKDRLNEEQYTLFKKEKYSPFLGLIPLFVQLILIIGVLQVIYNPMQHMLRLDKDVINAIVMTSRALFNVQGGSGEQLRIIEILRQPENLAVFRSALEDLPNADNIFQMIANTDLNFLGLNLGMTPSFAVISPEMSIPVISGLAALALCLTQSAISPGALSQGAGTNWGLTIFTVALTLYFTFVTPVGVGVYWTTKNLLGIVILPILNSLWNPDKLAGEALIYIRTTRKTSAQMHEERLRNKALRIREKRDVASFCTANKQLVFYAITGGQYKYCKNIIEYILEQSDIVIHYLTNDPDDAIFEQKNKKLIPYYASENRTISLMLKLDADIVVTTVPGMQNDHIKRSVAREDIEYIFIPHGLAGGVLTSKEDAFDHFDTFFCIDPTQTTYLRQREAMAGLKKKNLIKVGYGVYDQLIISCADISHIVNEKPRILIAPSRQDDNIMELCIDDIFSSLLGKGYNIIVRPHPQFTRMFPERIEAIAERYKQYIDNGELVLETEILGNKSIFTSDVLITDWSNIAYEFSYCRKKPSIFINTPIKVMNPNYKKYGVEVLMITLRDMIGVSVDVNDVKYISSTVAELLKKKVSIKTELKRLWASIFTIPGGMEKPEGDT